MLLKLTPEDVNRMWDLLKPTIVGVLAMDDGVDYAKVSTETLNACLRGILTVWILGDYEGNKFTLKAVLTTMPFVDIPTGRRELLVYTLMMLRPVGKDEMAKAFMKLKEYARSYGYKAITGFSDVPQVIKLVELLGGKTNVRYLTLEV